MASVISSLSEMGQSYLNWDATDSALDAQEAAVNALQGVAPGKANSKAQKFDIERFKQGFSTQEKFDPLDAALRKQGTQAILDSLAQNASGTSLADRSLGSLNEQTEADNAQNAPMIKALLAQATNDIASGATLPPEFQAELVRSGLSNSATSGYNLDGSGVAGSNTRTLLGSAGLQLQNDRIARAQGLAGEAAGLQTQRQNALSNLIQLDNNLRAAKTKLGAQATGIGLETVPSVGISGSDAVTLLVANNNLANNKTLALGDIKAQKRLAEGQMYSEMVGSGTNLIGSLAGGLAGAGMFGGNMQTAAGGVAGAGGGANFAAGSGNGFQFLNGLFGGMNTKK